MTKEPKRQKTLEERRAIVEDYIKSGKSLKEYSQGREFSLETLRRWFIGHKKDNAVKEEGFVELRIEGKERMITEIDYPNGVKVRFSGMVCVELLKDLIRC